MKLDKKILSLPPIQMDNCEKDLPTIKKKKKKQAWVYG